jgi:hypothetical protein
MNPKVAIHSSLSKTRSAILIRTRKINRKISKHVPTGVQVILHHLVLVAICVFQLTSEDVEIGDELAENVKDIASE